ncbi:MAG: PilN domain-containing protein [Bacillota bacterium]|nr:PilN domain-containing protein [Bacillota bacterium]
MPVVMYKMNLLPPELTPRPPLERKKLPLLMGTALLFGLVLCTGLWFFSQMYVMKLEIQALKAEALPLRQLAAKVSLLQQERKETEQAAKALNNLLAGAQSWSPLLRRIEACIPVDVWLTNIEITHEKKALPSASRAGNIETQAIKVREEEAAPLHPNTLIIKGKSRSFSSIGVFVRKLLELPFSTVILHDVQETKETGELEFVIKAHPAFGGIKE